MTYRIRAAPAYQPARKAKAPVPLNVDRAALTLRNVTIMMADQEALGHGMMSDQKTIQQTVALGNARPHGVIGRLGHPGMSENASGRQIFTASNFRDAGDRAVADLHLFEPARRSPAFGHDAVEWALDMAEQHPEHLAMSVVVEVATVWQVGEEEIEASPYGRDRPENATTELPLMRVQALHAVDMVVEGALTNGMFGAHEASFYAEGLFEYLDQFRAQFNIGLDEIPGKADQIVQKYLHARGAAPTGETMLKKNANLTGVVHKVRAFDDMPPVEVEPEDEESLLEDHPDAADSDDTANLPALADTNPLDEAEATAAATADDLNGKSDDDEGESSDDADGSDVPDVEAQMGALLAQNTELQSRLDRVERVLNLTVGNVDRLNQEVRRIDAEPVVSGSVRGGRGLPIGGRTATPPAPPTALQRQTPGVVTKRQVPGSNTAPDFDADPTAATLAAALNRQKHTRTT